MSTSSPGRPELRNSNSLPSDGRGWAAVALLVAAGYYALVLWTGAYEGLLLGLVVPVSLGVEAYARAADLPAAGAVELLPTALGLLAGGAATGVALLSAAVV